MTNTETSAPKHTMLLVEDNNDIANTIYNIAHYNGGHVVHCATAEEALAWLENERNRPIACILTDLDLGAGMNGGEFVKRVRKRWDQNNLATLLVGYSAGQPPRDSPICTQTDAFYQKGGSLIHIVREMLEGKIWECGKLMYRDGKPYTRGV